MFTIFGEDIDLATAATFLGVTRAALYGAHSRYGKSLPDIYLRNLIRFHPDAKC